MLRKSVVGVVVCLAGAGLSFGQEFPKPGLEHEHLQKLEGTWDAVMEMGGQKSKATATYKAICGGMWLESDFEGQLAPGLKFQGHGLDGYDQTKKKYVAVWVDSMSSAPLHMEGNYDDQKVMVMTGESVGPDGKPQKFKTTTEEQDDDHFTFKMYMVQPGGQEELAFTITYTRRE